MPLPGVALRVHDDQRQPLPAGEIGGIEVRGRTSSRVTGACPRRPRGVHRRRWFKTGDVGRFDSDGYVTIVGRSKDLIISGGYNVYPAEIEATINELPGVAEIGGDRRAASRFRRGGGGGGRRRGGARRRRGVVAALKARIANFKVPKQVFVVNELPRNTMGKVQKNLLRDSTGSCSRKKKKKKKRS